MGEIGTHGNLLVVDDDRLLLDTVGSFLTDAGYHVTKAEDGQQALSTFAKQKFDLVIADLKLPGSDGLTMIRALRKISDVGIVILSGLGETTDRIIGLEVGADDYLAKPFELRELLARVRSVLRRMDARTTPVSSESQFYVFGGWKMDVTSRKLTSPEGQVVDLTSGEFNLLQAFVQHPNRVLSRNQLLDCMYHNYTPAFERAVDVQLGRLRRKIEKDPKKPQLIKTIRGAGYMFSPKVVVLK
jgi:two-component system OmpR family response regulator